MRIDRIPISYSDDGAREEGQTKSMQGVLIPGQMGGSMRMRMRMRMRYTGDVEATVVYAKVGERYDLDNPPKLLSC